MVCKLLLAVEPSNDRREFTVPRHSDCIALWLHKQQHQPAEPDGDASGSPTSSITILYAMLILLLLANLSANRFPQWAAAPAVTSRIL